MGKNVTSLWETIVDNVLGGSTRRVISVCIRPNGPHMHVAAEEIGDFQSIPAIECESQLC